MYIITSNTDNDIAIDVIQNSKSKIVHLTKKYSTEFTDELTEKILFLDSKNIIKYSEILNNTSNNEVKEQQSRRGRKPKTESVESVITEESVDTDKEIETEDVKEESSDDNKE